MALSTATLQTQLDDLITAMATGTLSVRSADGRQVTYESLDKMSQHRDWLIRQIRGTRSNVRLGRYNPNYDREVSGG